MTSIDRNGITTLYVMVDDFCHSHPPTLPTKKPGPQASLCASEVITLAIFARWGRFSSERDFYRYARTSLCSAFPTLPDRSQFNRLVRFYTQTIEKMALHLARIIEDSPPPYQALDASAMPVRDAKRREAPRTRLACWTGRHRLVQQLGLVRGVLPFDRRRAFRRDHRLLLWSCL